MSCHHYKRVLLKLSGESLMGSQKFGISYPECHSIAIAIKEMQSECLQVAIVIGGGNIFRGVNLKDLGMPQTPADQMGMLATMINGIALQQALIALGCQAVVMSALECPKVADSYNWQKTLDALDSGHVVIFVGGTGNPYFTTDTAAAMRASEIHADVLLKATKVDGIYNKDPLKYPEAKKYPSISYSQALAEKLEVMDSTAIALCMNNKLPIYVFCMDMLGTHSIRQLLSQSPQDKNFHGTIVHC